MRLCNSIVELNGIISIMGSRFWATGAVVFNLDLIWKIRFHSVSAYYEKCLWLWCGQHRTHRQWTESFRKMQLSRERGRLFPGKQVARGKHLAKGTGEMQFPWTTSDENALYLQRTLSKWTRECWGISDKSSEITLILAWARTMARTTLYKNNVATQEKTLRVWVALEKIWNWAW